MRKYRTLANIIVISVILGGLYGIIHDQITYTISPEYFTKFKYIQFGVDPAQFGGDRQTVLVIGFLATWWMGAFIGIVLGLCGLIFPDHRSMFRAVMRSILLAILIAMTCGILGFLYGKFHLTKTGVDWWLPEKLIDKNSFIEVGSIHNSSYIGGIVGLATGVLYLLAQYKKQNVRISN